MNLKQRSSRYGAGVQFMAGLAGVFLVAAALRAGFAPGFEIGLAAAVVVSLILHARMGFALSRAQLEIDMLQSLSSRCEPDPAERAHEITPPLSMAPQGEAELTVADRAMLERVRGAVENDRLDLYLQPIVSLPQRKIRYFEAFSRLRDDQGAMLRPADYLDAAERANRIGVIDNMILLRCIQSFARIESMTGRCAIFCNISPATLYDTDFFNHFTDYLEMNRGLSQRLIFEFTYPALQMMHPRFEANLQAIAKRGFVFSVDHVHSLDIDWRALRERNVRFAKASAALLHTAAAADGSGALLRAYRKRIEDAGIDLIAEKIEFETDMPEILALGLDYGQGNLFGAPQPARLYLREGASEPQAYAKAS